MKILSRDFTTMEKVLLFILVIILLGLVYYQFVDKNVRGTIEACEAEAQAYQTQLDAVEARVAYLQSLQNSMDSLKQNGQLTWMGSYNNSKEEVDFLNDILADTLQYAVSFASVTRSGNQIRRSFTLQYTTADHASAGRIMTRLLEGKNRCLVGDVRCGIGPDGTVTMTQSATFYETMVGGVADAGLPADGAAVNY